MNTDLTQHHRESIWKALSRVARPDSRFHWDFSSFICDFEGSDLATERVRELPAWREASRVFVTPDNSTELLRRAALADGKSLLVTTYGIRRGFIQLDPADVPPGEISYAATLDGIDRLGRPVTLTALAGGPPLRLLVTGGSAISRNGIRFGKGHGYFDLEWAILSEIGLAHEGSEIVDVVHDCQVVDVDLVGAEHDVPVDWIVTPTGTIGIPDVQRRPGRVLWDLLPGTEHEHLPPIEELRAMRTRSTS
ncbi:MAG: 5-formyltetrahydrofolate cyclo-ligase [Sphaerisporangium sp.]|nr:5-formyltetrahydrofolate cyclo-ligase [Sphaerisporangium sp.]